MFTPRRLPHIRHLPSSRLFTLPPSPNPSTLPPPLSSLYFSTPPSFHTNESLSATRKANLGSMVDYLRTIIPEALRVVPDSTRLDRDIILRVAPTITPNVPMIKGSVSYITALKATQLIFTSFILGSDVKLHLTELKIDEDGQSGYGLYKGATKIVVKWVTCDDDCVHLQGTGRRLRQEAHEKHQHMEWRDVLKTLKIVSETDEQDHEHVGRVMSGLFVFELNKENDRILVHNVENIEMLDKKNLVKNVRGNLATG